MDKFDIQYFETHYSDGYCCRETETHIEYWFETEYYYCIRSVPKDREDLICVQKKYYVDTLSLMIYSHYLREGHLEVGEWKAYEEDGELAKEEDKDEGFPFKWPQVYSLLKANDVDIDLITDIWRYMDVDNTPKWLVTTCIDDHVIERIYINASSGELLSREKLRVVPEF